MDHKTFLSNLKNLLSMAQKYGFTEYPKFENKLLMLSNNEVLLNIFMKETQAHLKLYTKVISSKDYDYPKKNRLDLGDKDISDFINLTWRSIDLEDKKKMYRYLAKMYNATI